MAKAHQQSAFTGQPRTHHDDDRTHLFKSQTCNQLEYKLTAPAEDTPPQTLTRKKSTAGLLALRSRLFAFAFPNPFSGSPAANNSLITVAGAALAS